MPPITSSRTGNLSKSRRLIRAATRPRPIGPPSTRMLHPTTVAVSYVTGGCYVRIDRERGPRRIGHR